MIFRSRKQRQAFEKEALPYLDALYAMALKLTRDEHDAEDLVQDALVKAFRFFHRYQEGSNIKSWLFKVLINLFYNDRRKAKKDRKLRLDAKTYAPIEQLFSEASVAGQRPEEILVDPMLEEQLKAALEDLPDEFRLAVILCDLYDFSYKEIAEILQCPVGTVMSRLYRGRRQLQGMLYQYALDQGYIRAPDRGSNTADLETYRRRKEGV